MLRTVATWTALQVLACGHDRARPERPPPGAARLVTFEGTCDASGAGALDDRRFALGDDEDNVLRVYDADRGGRPRAAVDVGAALSPGRRHAEADIEAATRFGDLGLWLASHGRKKSGKRSPERLVLFATTLPTAGHTLGIHGRPYRSLVDDLVADPRLAALGLREAAARPPQDPAGLNIEGMTAAREEGVLIGFRTPVPGGRALLVPLQNPGELPTGGRPRLGDPILLDLGGLGVRALSLWRGLYLIVAGAAAHASRSRLFTWQGPGTRPREVSGLDLRGVNPEAFFTPDARDSVLLLSDDGERLVDGEACKRLEDPADKRFRGVWVGAALLRQPP